MVSSLKFSFLLRTASGLQVVQVKAAEPLLTATCTRDPMKQVSRGCEKRVGECPTL